MNSVAIAPGPRSRLLHGGLILFWFSQVVLGCKGPAPAEERPAPRAHSAAETGASRAASTATRSVPAGELREAGPLSYVEITTGGAAANDKLPLILAIHGRGDKPDRFLELFAGMTSKARVVAPRGLDASHSGWSWFPMRGNSANAVELARGVDHAADLLHAAALVLLRERPTLGSKLVVLGFSQGGILSFTLAARFPELITLAVPVSGMLPEPLRPASVAAAERAQLPRLVAFHGDADEVLPIGPAQTSVEWFNAAGFTAELRSFKGVAHRVTPAMRAQIFELIGGALPTVP